MICGQILVDYQQRAGNGLYHFHFHLRTVMISEICWMKHTNWYLIYAPTFLLLFPIWIHLVSRALVALASMLAVCQSI